MKRPDDYVRRFLIADVMSPSALRAAAAVGLLEALASCPDIESALVQRLKLDADALCALLRLLEHHGVVERDATSEAWRLTPTALANLMPSNIAALALDGLGSRIEYSGRSLLHTLRHGESAYDHEYGENFWTTVSRDRDAERSLHDYLDGNVDTIADAVCDLRAVREARYIVDVGGGRGRLARHIARRHSETRVTVFDRAPVAAPVAASVSGDGGGRVDVALGDFFDSVPPGADLYLLCQVLHDWSDPDAVRILRRVAEAGGQTADVVVVERAPGDESAAFHYQNFRMLMLFGACERIPGHLEQLATEAGMNVVETSDLGNGFAALRFRLIDHSPLSAPTAEEVIL